MSNTMNRYHAITDQNWVLQDFVARPFPSQWRRHLQPHLAINSSRLLVAAGNMIYSYAFISSSSSTHSPRVQPECVYSTSNTSHPHRDVTSLICVPDGGLDRTIYAGYANGVLERLVLPALEDGHDPSLPIQALVEESYNVHANEAVMSLSLSPSHLLALTASGTVVYLPLEDSITSAQCLQLNARSWVSHLFNDSSSPYAAFGTSARKPLSIHAISPSGLSPDPIAFLRSNSSEPIRSAVYALDHAPTNSLWGASDQIIVSGWYDGLINIHDLSSVGSMFAVEYTWKSGATGVPSASNRCSFGPSVVSMKICQPMYSSVWLYCSMKFDSAAHGSWTCW